MLKRLNDYHGSLMIKYDNRGWQFQDVLWPEDESSHGCLLNPRRIGDRYTWTIPLDIEGVRRPDRPDSVLEYASFRLKKNDDNNPRHYEVMAKSYTALTLKYEYIYDMNYRGPDFWLDFLGPRMDTLSIMELYKKPPETRSLSLQESMQDARPGFHLISDELYQCGIELPGYDHEIPGWYAQWEKEQAAKVKTV